MGFESEYRSSRGGHAAMVRLCSPDRHQGVGTGCESLTTQPFEFADLVASGREAGQIVTFDPESTAPRSWWCGFERRGQGRQTHPRPRIETIGSRSEPASGGIEIHPRMVRAT